VGLGPPGELERQLHCRAESESSATFILDNHIHLLSPTPLAMAILDSVDSCPSSTQMFKNTNIECPLFICHFGSLGRPTCT
jgi:hypothetical protein